jgi:hypothetical protein
MCWTFHWRDQAGIRAQRLVVGLVLTAFAQDSAPLGLDRRNDGYPAKSGASRLGNLISVDDSLPLDLGFLEIDQQTQSSAPEASQVVEALRGVLVGETLGTFQLDHQHILREDIGEILAHATRSVKASQYPHSSVFISGPSK